MFLVRQNHLSHISFDGSKNIHFQWSRLEQNLFQDLSRTRIEDPYKLLTSYRKIFTGRIKGNSVEHFPTKIVHLILKFSSV